MSMRPGLLKRSFTVAWCLAFFFAAASSAAERPEYLLHVSTSAGSSNLFMTDLGTGKTLPLTLFSAEVET